MIERDDNRVLGAIRWVDAVTSTVVNLPLTVTCPNARFVRNLAGLSVITSAAGLEKKVAAFDSSSLAPADVVPVQSLTFNAQVADVTGTYLPRVFTFQLPRDEAPAPLATGGWSATSLFTPMDVALLPAPAARMAPGWAQVRVAISNAAGAPLPNALVRVVASADGTVLGRGMSDARGEALVPVPALKLFAPGLTPTQVVTSETAAKLQIILPGPGATVVDWTLLDAQPVDPANIDPKPLSLRAGQTYSRVFPFPA